MNPYHYYDYAVINRNGKDVLVKAHSGFAAEAWKENDERFQTVLASSFYCVDGDTGEVITVPTRSIRGVENLDEFKKLHQKSCAAFKFWVEAEKQVNGAKLTIGQKVNAYSWLSMGFVELIKRFPDITPSQWLDEAVFGE